MDITLLGVSYALDQRLAAEEDTPAAFRTAGLHDRLAAVTGRDVKWRMVEPDLPGGKPQKRIAALSRALADAVHETRLQGRFPLIIGGDCMTSIGVVAGLQREQEDVAILWFDAHGDFNTWETTPSRYLGGMPLAMLVGRGDQTIVKGAGIAEPVSERAVILADARDLDPGEAEALATSEVIHLPNVKRLLSHPYRHLPIYVHLDVDVIDPAEMPAVDFPTPHGPNVEMMTRILSQGVVRAEQYISGMTLTALNVAKDVDGRCVDTAIELLEAFFEAVQQRRSSGVRYPGWLYGDDAKPNQELAGEYDAKRDALIGKIETAFADVQLPPKGQVFQKTDPDFYQPVPASFEDEFPRTHWKHIPVNVELYLFTPAGYRLVLPTYMVAALLNSEMLFDLELLNSFTGSTFYYPGLLEGLSKSQLQIVLEFVKFYDLMWDDFYKTTYKDQLEEAVRILESLIQAA
jgi:arginase